MDELAAPDFVEVAPVARSEQAPTEEGRRGQHRGHPDARQYDPGLFDAGSCPARLHYVAQPNEREPIERIGAHEQTGDFDGSLEAAQHGTEYIELIDVGEEGGERTHESRYEVSYGHAQDEYVRWLRAE